MRQINPLDTVSAVTKWEYTQIFVGVADITTASGEWLDRLNEMGSAGWELVAEHHNIYSSPPAVSYSGTLKRPSSDPE